MAKKARVSRSAKKPTQRQPTLKNLDSRVTRNEQSIRQIVGYYNEVRRYMVSQDKRIAWLERRLASAKKR
ncbi:hypothetical protein GF351_04615 [Candidatus Woesearchaeota archaeon]|nr:hypothetical protein [Candidatus Woesearchaeota archaeon]